MKIAQNNLLPVMPEAYSKTVMNSRMAPSPSAGKATARRESDRVCISEGSRLLQEALRTGASAGDTGSEKVAALREQIQNGTYRPDSRKIAGGMLEASLTYAHLRNANG